MLGPTCARRALGIEGDHRGARRFRDVSAERRIHTFDGPERVCPQVVEVDVEELRLVVLRTRLRELV